jgi:hypothetical protein
MATSQRALFFAVSTILVVCPQNQAQPFLTGPDNGNTTKAYCTAATGQVSIQRDQQPWAISSGEQIPIQQTITTGADGFARFQMADGSTFELYANTRLAFRKNAATAGDLLDVISGRVRIHLNPQFGHAERVFTPVASLTARDPATISVAVDEDETVRVDVLEGEVKVQHLLLPRSEPTLVKAIDAILLQKDQQISRQVDRGTLYRYTVKPLHDLFSAIAPGHPARPEEQFQAERFVGRSSPCSD